METVSLPVRFLETKNKVDDSDAKIKFQEEGHQYWIFSRYLNDWPSSKDGCGSAPVVSSTTILGKYFLAADFHAMAIRIWNNPTNRVKMETDPHYKYYACRSVTDITNMWAQGAILGTRMHGHFEDFANLVEYDRDNNTEVHFKQLYDAEHLSLYPEKKYFMDFCNKFKIFTGEVVFWRTEFLMCNTVLHISGMIDALLYDTKSDSYIIIDYKRVKNGLTRDPKNPRKPVHELSSKTRGQILPAFTALRNNNENKYGCQLTLYKNLFESMFPSKKISGMFLVVVDSEKLGSPTALEFVEIPLQKYQDCIDAAFAARAQEILSNHEDNLPYDLVTQILQYIPKIN